MKLSLSRLSNIKLLIVSLITVAGVVLAITPLFARRGETEALMRATRQEQLPGWFTYTYTFPTVYQGGQVLSLQYPPNVILDVYDERIIVFHLQQVNGVSQPGDLHLSLTTLDSDGLSLDAFVARDNAPENLIDRNVVSQTEPIDSATLHGVLVTSAGRSFHDWGAYYAVGDAVVLFSGSYEGQPNDTYDALVRSIASTINVEAPQ